MRSLERARVARATRQGCRWVEGLAAEQLGAAGRARGAERRSRAGRRERAWDAYAAWGAGAKLDAAARQATRAVRRWPPPAAPNGPARRSGRRGIDHRPSDLTRGIRSDHSATGLAYPRSSATSTESLDFASVLAASERDDRGPAPRARSSAGCLTRRSPTSAPIAGVLLLERDGVLGVVAEARSTATRRSFESADRAARGRATCARPRWSTSCLRTEQVAGPRRRPRRSPLR